MCAGRDSMEERIIQKIPERLKDEFSELIQCKKELLEYGKEKGETITGNLYLDVFQLLYGDGSAVSMTEKSEIGERYSFSDEGLRKKYEQFVFKYRNFRENLLECMKEDEFFKILKTASQKNRQRAKKSSGNSAAPQDKHNTNEYVHVKVKREYMADLMDGISRSDMLEGLDEDIHLTFEDLNREGFLNIGLRNGPQYNCTSVEFIECERIGGKYSCEILTGGIGAGKTVLTYRVAERLLEKWEERPKNLLIIFVSAWSQDELGGKQGLMFLKAFLGRNIPKRGKIIVVVDGLDELITRGTISGYDALITACQYYRASLIANCRENFLEKIKKSNRNTISSVWRMTEINPCYLPEEIWKKINSTDLSPDLVRDLMRLPYYCTIVNSLLPEKISDVQVRIPRYCSDDYSFVKKMYQCLFNRERGKYELDQSFCNDVKIAAQKIAMTLHEYEGDGVTLRTCFGGDEEMVKRFKPVLTSQFFNEIVDIEFCDENFSDGIVKQFFSNAFYIYFLLEEFCACLKGSEEQRLRALSIGISQDAVMKMKNAALRTMPGDQKREISGALDVMAEKKQLSEDIRKEIDQVKKMFALS